MRPEPRPLQFGRLFQLLERVLRLLGCRPAGKRLCTEDLHRPIRAVTLSADARADVARVQQIWMECRERYGKLGLFLFGSFGGADAMFAPVVHRFRSYAIPVEPEVKVYMETMMALPAFGEWTRAGLAETLIVEKFEEA